MQKRGVVAQPVVLSHALDQDQLGAVFRTVFRFRPNSIALSRHLAWQ
ncbi:MAG TPA: hypothetical protein VGK64_08830 [Bryobacteraceae bacterium]